jgi:MFS family permease
VTYADWRWIFLINLPMGALGIWLGLKYVPDLREPSKPLDGFGFLLSGGGLALALFGFSTLGRHLVSTEMALGTLVAGLLAMAGYVVHARHHPHPLLDLQLFRLKTFSAGVVGGSLFRIGIGATPLLLPLMLQLGFGLSPLQSGLLTFASAIGAMFMKTIAAAVLRRFGFRRVLWVNALIGASSMIVYGLFRADTPHWLIIGTLILGGCFRSLQFTSLNAISYAEVDPPRMGQASSLSGMMQQLSLALGVTIGGYALQMAADLGGRPLADPANFSWAFAVVGLMSATSVFMMLRLPANAGAEMAGHGEIGKEVAEQKPEQRPAT